jgi:hypothetical protein
MIEELRVSGLAAAEKNSFSADFFVDYVRYIIKIVNSLAAAERNSRRGGEASTLDGGGESISGIDENQKSKFKKQSYRVKIKIEACRLMSGLSTFRYSIF